ncbi:ABC transporter ATP-binding protein [Lactiplantibacillus mudanjiangensis]|uniref:Multidrug ABC transporter ATPase [Lactobacillus koreensis] n=1 Tax=Lactiplantibacillus mudanjiangensis TaxID=1296538 RepID=A0A660E663_9LACO|nr:ABC transporter ATP-binding protein [Lactiplantibacillus mudanjiangensis]VDG23426.1 multidrug ABC transporter ATPase [Lactobacillus koreensis] [Lactiplantibacillus mudanjiangensis]VDG28580.1 multidrug ABC transporter ATPase [Lactobacillus koreensis] [Lactiplantibacillus mudanjiangensis]
MAALIEANDIEFSYGKQAVLKGLSLTIKQGEIIGLIGENGAGKTTLLNLLLGVHPIQQGQLTVFGQQPGTTATHQRIGSMLQGDLVLRGVTVKDLLTLAAARYDQAVAPVELMATLDLTKLANQKIATLSGGQQRRVTFALALIGNPDLLFLDEPTVGMDTNAQQAFWQRIKKLKAQGKTVIITSHYLPEIQNVADRILLLQGGQLIFQGTFQALQQQYQQVEITCQTELPATTFTDLPGVTAVSQDVQTVHISSEDGDATLGALTPFLSQLHQVTVSRESLADIFVHLTKGVIA